MEKIAKFGGVSQESTHKCGVHGIIYLDRYREIKLWLNCGPSINTRGELMGLWMVLHFAKSRSVILVQVVDCKLGKKQMLYSISSSLVLDVLCLAVAWRVTKLIHHPHFHGFNELTNDLSMRGLLMVEGAIHLEFSVEDSLVSTVSLTIFN